jgi:hypothetical protein
LHTTAGTATLEAAKRQQQAEGAADGAIGNVQKTIGNVLGNERMQADGATNKGMLILFHVGSAHDLVALQLQPTASLSPLCASVFILIMLLILADQCIDYTSFLS